MLIWRLSLRNSQLPPTSVPFSNPTAGTPASSSAFSTVIPEEPAPITAVAEPSDGGRGVAKAGRLLKEPAAPARRNPSGARKMSDGDGGCYAEPRMRRVLIVEDSPSMRAFVRAALVSGSGLGELELAE